MSYIIWKNRHSDDVKGLLISELSPISKPKMRTTTTEIDGKDGDVVEYLGYKSYTKTISIGLTKNYDIDEIINYFNGSGKLILSNEPDKYYKYLLNEAPFVLNITNETSLKVSNRGYEQSKPIITLYGTGTIQLLVNGNQIFSVDMVDDYITIDSEQEEAYHGLILKNRQMTGDFPKLNSGINIISWVGNLTKIEVNPRSRWL